MGAAELTMTKTSAWAISAGRRAWIPLAIFVFSFLAYYFSAAYLISPTHVEARPVVGRYQHYLYLADAMLHGTLDLNKVGYPSGTHDLVACEQNAICAPFPPGPSFLLMPFVAIAGQDFVEDFTDVGPLHGLGQDASQIIFTMIIGAINVTLLWYLLGLLRVGSWTRSVLPVFFAFGTVHFFTATTGTAWMFAHVTAVFYLLLAIIFMLRRAPPVVPTVLVGLAFLSREPTALAAPFFVYWYFRNNHDSLKALINGEALRTKATLVQFGQFFAGTLPFIVFWFWYNDVRFGGPLDILYKYLYLPSNQYSFYRGAFPNAGHFGLLDPRNIPLHLYTIFLMPPEYHPDLSVFRPNPYGLSVLVTSPAFVYAAFVKRKDPLVLASWVAIAAVSVPLFLHYSQGWVQFGYRFLLDFAPFLLILTAFGFDDHTSRSARVLQVSLVAVSVLAGFWGRYWATLYGW